ncbi:hypothetical protein Droror1_Dr00006769 [Drosera rotundifolia]
MATLLEIEQPTSTIKLAGTGDDDFSLSLNLSEDDPLFDQKKTMLEDKSLAPGAHVYFNSSSTEWISSTIEALLHKARIVHLNEAEMYFGEMSVDPPAEFYSPRNELQALNHIVSLIDISIENYMHETTACLQKLRDEVIKKIHEFGQKYSSSPMILEKSCDKEKDLLQWARSNGSKCKLQIAYIEGAGRGAVAADDLDVGEVVLEIPTSLIISEDLLYESDTFHVLEKIEGVSAETMLLLWSMKERHNRNSKYKLYFDTLPEKFYTGLSFEVGAVAALDGTFAFDELCQAKEHLRSQYDQMFPALCTVNPGVFPPEIYTWENYLWACELWYSNSMKVLFTDGKLKTCLVPVAGFLNHSICPHIMNYGKVDARTNSLKFPLARPCRAGEECYLSYGNLSSSHLLIFYGFVPKEPNPYDVIQISFSGGLESCSEDDDMSDSDGPMHMVRGTWLLKHHGIFYYGLPTPLLQYLRKVENSPLHTMILSQSTVEKELVVLENLRSIFVMIDSRYRIDEYCWGCPSWDVQLALTCKAMERQIVSSVLHSCDEGIKMLQAEWIKFMDEDVRG